MSPNEAELTEILKSVDYIKLTGSYMLYGLPQLEKLYSKSVGIKNFFRDKRILCMETRIGGMAWLEKARNKEYLEMKRRNYRKVELVLIIELGQDRMEVDQKVLSYKSTITCYAGFEWNYSIKIQSSEMTEGKVEMTGEVEWSNKLWQPEFDFCPVIAVDLEMKSSDDKKDEKLIGLPLKHTVPLVPNCHTLVSTIHLLDEFTVR